MKKFAIQITVVTWLLFTVYLLVMYLFCKQYYHPIQVISFIYFYSLTVASHFVLIRAGKLRFPRFSNAFMGVTTVKLLASVIFMAVFLYLRPEYAYRFALPFSALYLFYTVFEVYSLLAYFGPEKTNRTSEKA